jgi:hypothetical protein
MWQSCRAVALVLAESREFARFLDARHQHETCVAEATRADASTSKERSMAVDRTNFLLLAGALAAGGVGGWTLRDRTPKADAPPPPPAAPAAAASATQPEGPVSVDIVSPISSAAACDDTVGAAEECPSVGPSDEGVCSNIIFKRCGDFKAAFKPKVAQAAVACLRQLKGSERCDPVRVNQCGHAALMTACPEPSPPLKGMFQSATASTPASVTLSQPPLAVVSPMTKVCEGLVETCHGQPLGATLNDCRQTFAGLSEAGRASMVDCVTAHCSDRGLLGCEAVPKTSVASTGEGLR